MVYRTTETQNSTNDYLTRAAAAHELNLKVQLSKMRRSRDWSGNGSHISSRYALGKLNAAKVITALESGQTIAEIGAGNMCCTEELAQTYTQNQLIAIEPFPPLEYVAPKNVTLIPKKAEQLTAKDLAEVALVFGVWVYDYFFDKLLAIQAVFNALPVGAQILFQTQTIDSCRPWLSHMLETIDPTRSQLTVDVNYSPKGNVIVVNKLSEKPLNTDSYELEYVASMGMEGSMITGLYKQADPL